MSNADKKATVGNVAAFYQKIKEKFMPNQTPQELRAAMGLGDTLGPLEEEYGGTGEASYLEALGGSGMTRMIGYDGVSASEFASNTAIISFTDVSNLDGYAVGENAFKGCTKLRSVSIPKCEVIGSGAFNGCTALESVSFPSCVTIGGSAFYGCTALTAVTEEMFPACEQVTGSDVFYGASSVESLNMPSLKTINGSGTFGTMAGLKSVRLPSLEAYSGTGVFDSLANTIKYAKLGGTSGTLSLYCFTSGYRNSFFGTGAADNIAIDLRGVKTITTNGYYVGAGPGVLNFLTSDDNPKMRIWLDGDITTSGDGYPYIAQGGGTVYVYTDASSLDVSGMVTSTCTLKYYYNQSYEDWLATYEV